jgi:hypothetical protein
MGFLKTFDDFFVSINSSFYLYGIIFLNVSYVLLFFGFHYIDKELLKYFSIFVQLFICVFLLIRFNPFRTHYLHKNDASIIFGSAIWLLANLGVTHYVYSTTTQIFQKNANVGKVLFQEEKKDTQTI